MEEALISPAGFMILSGAGLIEAGEVDPRTGKKRTIKVHTTEQTNLVTVDAETGNVSIVLESAPYFGDKPEDADTWDLTDSAEDYIYVMLLENGEVASEPFIPSSFDATTNTLVLTSTWNHTGREHSNDRVNDLTAFKNGSVVLVDYYVERSAGAQEITITPDKFGGNYYLEASTLFRNTDGVDMPAEFVIPNCKIQSNFTFTMASSGDPSTFNFTMDAFPDYTRFDPTKKVLFALQIVEDAENETELVRIRTKSEDFEDSNGMIARKVVTE